MKSVDVSDLPGPFARAVEAVAETFRHQLTARGSEKGEKPKKRPVELPLWPLGMIGNLTREEIYDHTLTGEV